MAPLFKAPSLHLICRRAGTMRPSHRSVDGSRAGNTMTHALRSLRLTTAGDPAAARSAKNSCRSHRRTCLPVSSSPTRSFGLIDATAPVGSATSSARSTSPARHDRFNCDPNRLGAAENGDEPCPDGVLAAGSHTHMFRPLPSRQHAGIVQAFVASRARPCRILATRGRGDGKPSLVSSSIERVEPAALKNRVLASRSSSTTRSTPD